MLARPQKQIPVRREQRGTETRERIPYVGPRVPRLQREHQTYAIGFTANICSETEDD